MLRAKGSVNVSQVNGIEGFCEGEQAAVMDVGTKVRQSVLERPQGKSRWYRTKDHGNNPGLTPTSPLLDPPTTSLFLHYHVQSQVAPWKVILLRDYSMPFRAPLILG